MHTVAQSTNHSKAITTSELMTVIETVYGSVNVTMRTNGNHTGYTVFNRIDQVTIPGYLTSVSINFFNRPTPGVAKLFINVIALTSDVNNFMIVEQYQIPSETITNNVVHSAAETFNLPTSLIRVDYGHYVGIGFGPDGGSACQLDRHMYYMHRTDLLSYITSVYPARFSNNMYRGAAFTFTITSEVPTVTRIPTAPVTYDSCDQNLQKKIPRVSGQTGFNYRYRAQYSGYVQNIRLNFYGTLNRVTNTIFLFTISAIPDTSTLFHIVDTYEVPSAQFPDSVGIHNIELLPGALNISDGQWLAISFQ
ncbi:unnamed protein product, partial [Didymodactylos carnosus]